MCAKANDLKEFIKSASHEIENEYKRIQMRATEDPGTAGDQGEENWASILRNWLPPIFQIVTKGRLLSYDGKASPQVDVIVLQPEYPKQLLNKKLYLAAGVIAAFECKTTLKSIHLDEFFKNSVAIRNSIPSEKGSPFKELHHPILFGLLSHSHSWKGENSTPIENIEKKIWDCDSRFITHPIQIPDIICVADLATWSVAKVTFLGPAQGSNYTQLIPLCGPSGSATTTYMRYSIDQKVTDSDETPIGALITKLIYKLAWWHPNLRGLANYYKQTNIYGNGKGSIRTWESEIYSHDVRKRIEKEIFPFGIIGEEWSSAFL